MSRAGRVRAEATAAWHAFVRRRTAVFFTFFFPVILIVIFGVLVGTRAAGGLFGEAPEYYLPGYLAVVVLFTPLSRVSSTVARHREGNRFERLATTPLTPTEWLLAHTLVNGLLVGLASVLVIALGIGLTGASIRASPLVIAFIGIGVVCFCGIGAVLGRLADSQDGAIAAANAIGLPLLFLSETFVPLQMLPEWFRVAVELSPLTYFARGVRAAIGATPPGALVHPVDPLVELVTLGVIGVAAFGLGVIALPWRT